MNKLNVVGLCGSLREKSLNLMALKLAGSLLPERADFTLLQWHRLPPFDADMLSAGFPSPVQDLAERIAAADGIVIATPEYNFSIPGMFKNAIDWLSRCERQPFNRKPVAILSASPGPLGGARVQYDLRKVLLYLDADTLAKPEVFIGSANTKFDEEGRCSDELTQKYVRSQMQTLVDRIDAVKS